MANSSSSRPPYFIPVMILFALAVLVFLGMLISYLSQPAESPLITNITQLFTFTPGLTPSATPTSTITLTPRPTWTLRPSATTTLTPTPTSTNTPTLIHTLSPASPAGINLWYKLKPWDLAEQSRIIELLKANTILTSSDDSFRALAYAEGEALLRFPQALDATLWRWDRAYDLVRINQPGAVMLYADLIKSALNSGQVRSTDLASWFRQYETRLTMVTYPQLAQPGMLGQTLIELQGAGSLYLWLVENPGASEVYPIINELDFSQPHENAHLTSDLTGDGFADLVIYRKDSPGNTHSLIPHIFNLSALPPVEYSIQDQAPIDFGLEPFTQVNAIGNSDDHSSLQVISTLLPSCPVHVAQEYHWVEDHFVGSPRHYELAPVVGFTAYCETVLDLAIANWGAETSIIIANKMLEVWPPENDIQGHPYPADALDRLRYRQGILYALAGRSSDAKNVLTELINTPTTPDSRWVTPAFNFLAAYQAPEDLFAACQQAQLCNLRDALRTMTLLSDATDLDQALAYLQSHGVSIRSSGLMDFDQDGLPERWMIILPKPDAKLEFWILYRAQTQVRALFVQLFEAGETLPYFHEPAGAIPVIQFELHKGFIFKFLPASNIAYIQWVDVEYSRPTIIFDGYQQALSDLFNGSNPLTIRDRLLQLYDSPRFTGDCIAFNICDQFHYTLAVVYDLLGESENAVDQYLWVWRNYGKSPFALLARVKLDYFPLPTYTRTPVPTRTLVPTRTTTPTRTSTSTLSPTMTHTPTMTLTPANTLTPTPTDTQTSTSAP